VIPVTEGVAWYEYSTKDLAGWPTPNDPFAAPAPWNLPDWEVTLLHLYKSS
jgi:peptide/nickel transport system substrate-binding protein